MVNVRRYEGVWSVKGELIVMFQGFIRYGSIPFTCSLKKSMSCYYFGICQSV